MSEPGRKAETGAAAGSGTIAQRIRARAVESASDVASRLPEPMLVRLAELGGSLWYRLDRGRATRGRQNLRRVCEWLAAEGLGPERARAAATDPDALEALLRSAFRHQARYYLEVALTPSMTSARVSERLTFETPDVVTAAFGSPRPFIVVGLHFGALELPALYLSLRVGRLLTIPMETIDDPPLQRWFVRTRGALGVRLIGLREARRELVAALRRGETVGLVADRDLTGGGIEIPLFGHPAPLPVGPALLALESEAPVFVAAVRRAGHGRYRGQAEQLEFPTEGTRRERVTAYLDAEARSFERLIAAAPDQWWAVFFPIWPDLAPAERAARSAR
jgi:phosphatidylinositol dimannoside acyltransferase